MITLFWNVQTKVLPLLISSQTINQQTKKQKASAPPAPAPLPNPMPLSRLFLPNKDIGTVHGVYTIWCTKLKKPITAQDTIESDPTEHSEWSDGQDHVNSI